MCKDNQDAKMVLEWYAEILSVIMNLISKSARLSLEAIKKLIVSSDSRLYSQKYLD